MPIFSVVCSIGMMLFFAMLVSCLCHEKGAGISPTPVMPWVRRKAMRMVPPEFDKTKHYEIADLGCGWGGLATSLTGAYPQSHVTGYEISPWPYWVSKIKALFWGGRMRVNGKSFFDQNISKYNLVFCYLSPNHMEKLKVQLSNLQVGSVVISCAFPIIGWDTIDTQTIKSFFINVPIYVYRIGLPVAPAAV